MAVVYLRASISLILDMRFLISLSICLVNAAGALCFSPCCLPFFSYQMVESTAWKTYLNRNKCSLCLVWSVSNRWISFRSQVYCTNNSFCVRFFHISSENLHSKKMWFRVSIIAEHRQQVVVVALLQLATLSPVGSLFWIAIQAMKEYFGVLNWNQIPLCQSTFGWAVRINIQVSLELNSALYKFSPAFHKLVSSLCSRPLVRKLWISSSIWL